MPFGVCNGPAYFQAWVDRIFHDLVNQGLIIFFNDGCIYADTEEELTKLTKEVFRRLRENGLFVNLNKCEFHVQEISFLGFIIRNGRIIMDPERVAAVLNWLTPTTLKQVQEFLGFCNFYR
jgi:hypothetical protein